jgi:SulP family sulfate permease
LALLAVAAVLWLGVLDGLLAAIGISLFMTLRGLAQARVVVLGRLADTHDFVDMALSPVARQLDGVLILRPEAPLFFGNVESLMGQVRAMLALQPSARQLILSLEETPDLDGTSVEALKDLSVALSQSGQSLTLARLKSKAFLVLQSVTLPHTRMTMLSIEDAVQLSQQATPSIAQV